LVLALVALVCISACGGGNSTPTAPSVTNAASVTLSAFTAKVQGAPGALTYRTSLHVAETGGKVGASITSFTFGLDGGGNVTTSGNAVHLAALQERHSISVLDISTRLTSRSPLR
jgi:hypothetical protein